MTCRKCHMTCRSKDCVIRHKENEKIKCQNGTLQVPLTSQCDKWWKCTTSCKVLNTVERKPELQERDEYKCASCLKYVMFDHKCNLRATSSSKCDLSSLILNVHKIRSYTVQRVISDPDCQTCTPPTKCLKCMTCKNCLQTWCGKPTHIPHFAVS